MQQPIASPTPATAGVPIRWRARNGVRRYRLQLALDNDFNDIVFDRAIETNTYRVTELPPGRYHWRVAPATTETESYTTVGVVTVAPAAPGSTSAAASGDRPAATFAVAASAPLLVITKNAGWQAATGEIVSLDLMSATNTAGTSTRILASDVAGTIYAFNSVRGVPLWLAHFDPLQKSGGIVDHGRKGSFAPLVIDKQGSASRVLARFADGVRLLDASDGSEIWRTPLEGIPTAGVRSDANSGGASLIVLTTAPDRIYFIDEAKGRITREQNLDGSTVGAPIIFDENSRTQILVAHESAFTIYSNSGQATPRTLKLDTRLTTPPHVVGAGADARLLFGTERGLVALRLPGLLPAWRIATEGDPPRGSLASRDVDSDGTAEAVMVTQSGRVALVDVARGAIRWVGEGATDARVATFADLDRDGTADVIVAGGDVFANAYSGRDGKLILRDKEEVTVANQGAASSVPPDGSSRPAALRSIIVANLGGTSGSQGSTLLIGADNRRGGLRAVRVSRAASGEKR